MEFYIKNLVNFKNLQSFFFLNVTEYLIGEKKKKKAVKCGDQYFSPTNNFTRPKLTANKNFYQLFFLLNKNQITEFLNLYDNLVKRRWVGRGSLKRKEKWVVSSLYMLVEKNMFYNQASLKRFSTFSTMSLAFSITSVIPAFLKPFIAISFSSLRVLYRLTIYFACSYLITELKRNF